MTVSKSVVVAIVMAAVSGMGCQAKERPHNGPSTAGSTTGGPATSKPLFGGPSLRGGVSEGMAAPDVQLALHDGSGTSLASLKGQHVVLYFYPKDDTPGCRVEAQGFRDNYEALTKANIKVFGVSLQGADSHRAFIEKERLPFPLVMDDGSVAKAFGVPFVGEFAARQTVLIGPDGNIKKLWRSVSPDGHAEEVLAAVKG